MKIVCMSDNHGDYQSLQTILNNNPDADYYFHMGDSQMYEREISPFVSVRGNNDFMTNYPFEKVVFIGTHGFYMLHGNTKNEEYFIDYARRAKELGCDIVLFGHTHQYFDQVIDGVRLINPGSSYLPHDRNKPCYAIITIDKNNKLDVKRMFL